MAKIVWDQTGTRYFESGVRQGVLYTQDKNGAYTNGVAWNGLTAVTESPSGADPTDLYADDIKYASMRAAETFGATIEAYTYPEEFAVCDGSVELAPGVMAGQQDRKTFGLSYRTKISNDLSVDGYKLHLIYGATASPSEKSYSTINDSPDANTFSWELTTNPVNVPGHKPTAILTINSLTANADKLAALEAILYGTDGDDATDAKLPTPEEVITLFGTESVVYG